ncbi:MAG TPA: hypothetical protein VF198_17685 [Vicinamibacterales bacterium]
MARGWESKAVESQQEDARRGARSGPQLTPDEQRRVARRRELELALARVRDGLARAAHPAHRATLEQAQSALEQAQSALEQELNRLD